MLIPVLLGSTRVLATKRLPFRERIVRGPKTFTFEGNDIGRASCSPRAADDEIDCIVKRIATFGITGAICARASRAIAMALNSSPAASSWLDPTIARLRKSASSAGATNAGQCRIMTKLTIYSFTVRIMRLIYCNDTKTGDTLAHSFISRLSSATMRLI